MLASHDDQSNSESEESARSSRSDSPAKTQNPSWGRQKKPQKDVSSDSENDSEEEEEEEDEEDTYMNDGFVVADDDIEEDEELEPQALKKFKVKKPKKLRRLKKRENEEFDRDDYDLINENLARNDSEGPEKVLKLEDSDEQSERDIEPGPNYNDYHTLAGIFAYQPQLTQPSFEKEPEFEPAERKERFRTKEFEDIKLIDVPERLQSRLKYRESPTQEELSAEAEWLFTRFILDKNAPATEAFHNKIERFLTLYRIEKCEIPFIQMYRKHKLSPELKDEHLWELERWDFDWSFVYESKVKFKEHILTAAENSAKIARGEQIDGEVKVLRNYEGDCSVPIQVRELLSYSYSTDFSKDIQDLQKFIETFIYTYPIKKASDQQILALNNRIPEFLQKSGINPLQFSENLKKRELIHKSNLAHVTPEDAAFDFLCDLYKDENKVISVAQTMMKKDISSLPWIRRFVREEYRKHVRLFTTPTDTGKLALDIYHPQYRVKQLSGKHLEPNDIEFWADVWKAEKSGWIKSEFSFPWKSFKDDKILHLLQPLLLSEEDNDIESSWNAFRQEILKQSLEEMYSEFSSELYNEFCLKAEDLIINRCKKAYSKIITKPALISEDDPDKGRLIAIVTDPLVEFFGQSVLVVMNSNGVVAEIGYFRTLASRNFETLSRTDQAIYRSEKKTIEKIVLAHRPHSVIIAVNCLHSLNIKRYMDSLCKNLVQNRYQERNSDWKIEQNSLLQSVVKIYMHDIEVPKIFAASQRGKNMLPDADNMLRIAVSLGRYVQFPLTETLGLWSDPNEILTPLLQLDPYQKLVNAKRLEWQLENVACEEVSHLGVDINKVINHSHLQTTLAFIPGLGQAKAYYLLENIYKKFKGKLKMRAALISKRILSAKVFENSAGFIMIRYEDKETDPLDSTRIHPESYDLAQKIAKSAMEVQNENKEDESVAKIMREPNRMKNLNLELYSKQLEDNYGQENMIDVMNFIVAELENPFHPLSKRPHMSFEEPSPLQLLYLASGESHYTLSKGKLVHCTVLSYDDRSQSLIVKLESGLKASIEKNYLCEDHDVSKEEMKKFVKGMSLKARVIEVFGKVGELDVFFKIRLSILPQDLAEHERHSDLSLDPSFRKAEEDWDDKAGLENDEYRHGQKYVPRVVNHPKYRNVGLKTACEYLEDKDIGECIFRPSSRGQDHLTCTWKFYSRVFAHLDIIEEGKPAQNMLGTRFKIGEEVYESLQEIIDRYIMPCEKLTKEAVSSPKFKDASINISQLLKQEKKQKPNTIPYYFSILEQYPQFLVLYYLPKEKPVTEYIKIKPRGLFFHEAYHTSLIYLIGWFKRHHSERNYQSQLQRIKPPVIDTTNYNAIKGRVERPMTPLHPSSGSARRDDTGDEASLGNRTPEDYDRSDDRRDKKFRRRSRGDRMDRGEKREERKCKKCGGEGHLYKDCTKVVASPCFNCNKEGHYAKDCREKKRYDRE